MIRKRLYSVALATALFSSQGNAACLIDRFDTLGEHLESAEAALQLAHHRIGAASIEDDTEYIGVIWKGQQGLSITVARGCTHSDDFEFRLRQKPGHRIVALWHTHGAPGPFRRMFSPADGHTVRHTGLTSYLLTANGRVKVLHPESLPRRPEWLRLPGSRSTRMKGYSGSWLNSAALATRR